MQADDLTIAGVARTAGVGVEKVRFYERRGLIVPPDKVKRLVSPLRLRSRPPIRRDACAQPRQGPRRLPGVGGMRVPEAEQHFAFLGYGEACVHEHENRNHCELAGSGVIGVAPR